jgi:hypothetical protein
MAVRLAFSVAIHVDPEILVVDEALAVGDAYFRQRCMRRINELRDGGVTIIFVSHSIADVRAIGDRALWLQHGRAMAVGDAGAVVSQYLAAVAGSESSSSDTRAAASSSVAPVEVIPNVDHRTGDGSGAILGIAVLDEFGDPLHLMIPGSRILIRISVRANRQLLRPDVGVRLRNHLGFEFSATSAVREGHAPGLIGAGETLTVDFHFEIPELYPGAFSFSPWFSEAGTFCDAIDNAITVQMARGDGPVYGYVQVPCRVELNPHPIVSPETEPRLV